MEYLISIVLLNLNSPQLFINAQDEPGSTINYETALLVLEINNDDIDWDFHPFMHPIINGASKKVLEQKNNYLPPLLLVALANEHQFAAAHVLLFAITLVAIERLDCNDLTCRFGFLEFDEEKDKYVYDFKRRDDLIAFWESKIKTLLPDDPGPLENFQTALTLPEITNDDIDWDFEPSMKPIFNGASKKLLEERNDYLPSLLLIALGNKRQFAAAHILLFKITGVILDAFVSSDSTYHLGPLVFKPYTFKFSYDFGKRDELIAFWKAKFQISRPTENRSGRRKSSL